MGMISKHDRAVAANKATVPHELKAVGWTAVGVGIVALTTGPLGPVGAALVAVPLYAFIEECMDPAGRPQPTDACRSPPFRERLTGLLGRVGNTIAGRLQRDVASGIWGADRSSTALYEVCGDGVRPVSTNRAREMRETIHTLKHVTITGHGASAATYVGGRLSAADGYPAAVHFDVHGRVTGAARFVNGRPEAWNAITAPDTRLFHAADAARAVAASLQAPARHPAVGFTGDRRTVSVDAVAWEAEQIMLAARHNIADPALAARTLHVLEQLRDDARTMKAAGIAGMDLAIRNPLDILEVAGQVSHFRSRCQAQAHDLAEAQAAGPVMR
ncbi:hypothetical protein [Azospirillum argentinense]|uniref:hypothetical protein n=1 Tax=Azospirillum argentinense TaxID=2970906 RepID=UPI0032DFECF3